MRYIIIAFLLNLIPMNTFAQIGVGTIISEKADVRDGPGESYKIIGQLNKGESRNIKKCSRGWVRWDTSVEAWSLKREVKIEYSNEYIC